MKQNGHRNNTAFILILLGMAFLLGTRFSSGRGLSFGRDRVEVREVVADRRTQQEIVEEKALILRVPPVPAAPAVPPIPPPKPMPPYPFIEETGLSVGDLIRSLLNNLLAVGLILVGIWLLVRHRRGTAVPPEKSPTSLDH